MSALQINHQRLWSRLMQMAKIGATVNGGCNRQALTTLDKEGRDLLIGWATELGCSHRFDEIGNLFIRKEGTQPELPPVITGSHLDTQPTGGKFDGIYGVLGGFEVIESIIEQNLEHKHSIEVVAWTNEEGSRFDCAMMGSAVWTDFMPLQQAYDLKAFDDGARVEDELIRLGHKGEHAAKAFPVKASYELHIEQGPVLEKEGLTIGVVTGVQHMSRHHLNIFGQECHAGPTPMAMRKDPVQALSLLLPKLYAAADKFGEDSRVTFGMLDAQPGSPNTVPGKLSISMDLRHPDEASYNGLVADAYAHIKAACEELGVDYTLEETWKAPGVTFAKDCVDAVQAAVNDLGYSNRQMVSGAGHDSVHVSKVCDTSMIFIPCRDGLSHNEDEYASPEHVGQGGDVLLNAMLRSAQ
ncbi:Zn-dependent hydrolase [Paraferrimonas sp. SM1919]|uniref:Zn-dependent hydrolase n=1 Tax=Paraferrimonas sp. SM1919 TaxID=2662263 RepID=UPI0013D14A92|nr:Zn-dependent hydrolase [Paraferrimonas sp. SM1919]